MSDIPDRIEPRGGADYLAVMSQAVFQAGLSWKLIASKWDAYLRLFDGFDPVRVAAFGELDIERIMNDGGIPRTYKKVVATVENARAILAVERDFGTVGAYLQSFPDYAAMAKDVRSRFKFVGELSAYYFAFRVGQPVPRFEEWEATVPGDHPRMREMIAKARAGGWPG